MFDSADLSIRRKLFVAALVLAYLVVFFFFLSVVSVLARGNIQAVTLVATFLVLLQFLGFMCVRSYSRLVYDRMLHWNGRYGAELHRQEKASIVSCKEV